MEGDKTITNITQGSEAAAVAAIVSKHLEPKLLDVLDKTGARGLGPRGSDEVPVLMLPAGIQPQSIKKFIDEYRTAPERREGTAKLVELESLVAHVNRFKDADSALFASPGAPGSPPTLTAVFDYHRRNLLSSATPQTVGGPPVVAADLIEGAPRFGRHRASYAFPLSDEWNAWLDQNGKVMAQGEFATWLEDRLLDVADPNSAFSNAKAFAASLGLTSFASADKLLQLSRGLTVHVDDRTTNRVDPSTGEVTMHFEVGHTDEGGAPLTVPRAFLIQIPVFRAGVAYQFPVRLKYRAGGGKVAWFYEIHDPRRALDDAFRAACQAAAEGTSLPLFYGAPES